MTAKAQKSVAGQLETVASMVKLVLNGQINALFIYGTPGIGKSSVVLGQLREHGKREGKGRPFDAARVIHRVGGSRKRTVDQRGIRSPVLTPRITTVDLARSLRSATYHRASGQVDCAA